MPEGLTDFIRRGLPC